MDAAGIYVAVIGAVLGALGLYIAQALSERLREGRTNRAVLHDLDRFVLIHFQPAEPGRLDESLPARMGRQEDRLAKHLDDEEAAAIEIATRLKSGEDKFDGLEQGQQRIEDKITEAVAKLSAGNPEVRP